MSEEVKGTQSKDDFMDAEKAEAAEKELMSEKEGTCESENMDGEGGKIEEMGMKLQEMTDKYLRLSAEFDNYRKRTLKEKVELIKNGGEQVLVKILPVVDNFERALASMEKSNDVEALRTGVELIYSNFKDFLAQNGVKEIACTDADFDTDVHEAITKIPAPSKEMKGKVVDCIEKGYSLNDKVIRFAKVVVGE